MKLQVSLAVILGLVACGAASIVPRATDGRIVGGYDTTIEDHPHQVSLVYFSSHRCGGSIITENFVLTAAHCLHTLSTSLIRYLKIRSGSVTRNTGGTLHDISYFTFYDGFTTDNFDYDVAVIRVKQPFEFGSTVQPIQLAPADYEIEDGTLVTVTGWGRLSTSGSQPTILQAVEVPIINNTYCYDLYSYVNNVTDRMVCAGYEEGGKDACGGDSGGPLVYNYILVGIVSWGDECAVAYQPGVYGRVSILRDWIEEKTGYNFD